MQHHSKYYFRFALEVIAVVFVGMWGSTFISGWPSFYMGVFCSFLFMLIWGLFNVPGDPSRSGKAPIAIPGKLRLILELLLFIWATVALENVAGMSFGIVYFVAVVAHNIHIKERTVWIWKN